MVSSTSHASIAPFLALTMGSCCDARAPGAASYYYASSVPHYMLAKSEGDSRGTLSCKSLGFAPVRIGRYRTMNREAYRRCGDWYARSLEPWQSTSLSPDRRCRSSLFPVLPLDTRHSTSVS